MAKSGARSGRRGSAAGGARAARQPVDLGRALADAFLTNERINQVLLEMLDASVWRAQPDCAKRRNIATTFAHMHNVRCMKLKMSGAAAPERLDRGAVTVAQARAALRESAAAMARLIESAAARGGRALKVRPNVAVLAAAMIAHDAHHRGQVCHWAAQLGAPLSPEQGLRMWEWDKRWKEAAGGEG